MGYRLVKIEKLSGNEASIYTILNNETNRTSFEDFLVNNRNLFISEIKDIYSRLNIIGHKTGAREIYFKLNEGSPGDGVCALYDMPDSNLRLYCIRYGKCLIILGGGGQKSKQIRSLQENAKLTEENYFLRKLSKEIANRTTEGELSFTNGGMDLIGNLNFYDDDE